MMKKKIYKTVLSFTILSENPYNETEYEPEYLGTSIESKLTTIVLNQELVGKNAVNAITELGADPELFMMDCEGNDISDEDYDENDDLILEE